MRKAIFGIALLNLAWFVALAVAPPSFPDAAGQGWVMLIGLIVAAFHVPALILVFKGTAQWLALVLVLIPLIYVLNGLIRALLS